MQKTNIPVMVIVYQNIFVFLILHDQYSNVLDNLTKIITMQTAKKQKISKLKMLVYRVADSVPDPLEKNSLIFFDCNE